MMDLFAVLRLGRPMTWRLLLAVAAGVGAAGAAIGLAATSAWLISKAAQQPVMLTLLAAVTAVRAFGIGRGVLRYAERLAAHDAAFRVLGELRGTVYARLVRLAPAGLAELRAGDLVARLVGDVDGLADLWLRVALPYASALAVVAGAAVLVGWFVPGAAVVLLASVAVTAFVAPLAAGLASRGAEARLAPARGALAATALDVLRAAPELLAAGVVDRALVPLRASGARLAAAERGTALGAGAGSLVAGISAGASVLASLVIGILSVRAGSLDGVALAVVALTPIAVHEVVAPLAPSARLLPALAASAHRVMELLHRPEPVTEPAPTAASAIPDGPLGLRIRDLEVRYPAAAATPAAPATPATPATTPAALGPVTLDIPAGARLVVTGRSGAGKSTLAAAYLRFVDPAAGAIHLMSGGTAPSAAALSDIPSDEVRRVIGLCEQDPHIFDASLADNLRLARPGAPDPELDAALAAAGLADWATTLPDGLQTQVGDHGARLSGGQRQRLALARALLADVRILVLDEPTEHLDEATARAFVADLPAAARDRTLLVLTHRPELFSGPAWVHGPELRKPG